MATTSNSSQLISLVAASATAVWLGASLGTALAGSHQGNNRSNMSPPPLHGPGSSHNPILRHPLHDPGSSHNPIVKTGSGKRNCITRGTVVHDHRNGKACSYVAGDSRSYSRYLQCEGIHSGGATPWC
jgi:hypothetical protein